MSPSLLPRGPRFIQQLALAGVVIGGMAGSAWTQTSETVEDNSRLVPQNLLKLMHASEVHSELQLKPQQVKSLETLFAKIDGAWFRARNLPQEKQFEVVEGLEKQVWDWARKSTDARQVRRLRELLYRSYGVRMLLVSDVIKAIDLEPSQVDTFRELARTSDSAQQRLFQATLSGQGVEEAQQAVKTALLQENQAVTKLLDTTQRTKVNQLRGQEFDVQSLERIYPMAPELEPVAKWINAQPLTLASLRGKVVLLHFYAFQCSNCHANFEHYQRWHKQYGDQVVVLGIQTPETAAEADPQKVQSAAQDRGLDFPIMVDVDKKNWNAWNNTMWPTVYVIDQDGYLRHWWQGELNWKGATGDKQIEELVDKLLGKSQKS
ncbi:MAG: redoxin domain-containing protein [Pirellulaceae bacterium]|nr:redoxin domain-containing protein [Pirellulaceae bacterium]